MTASVPKGAPQLTRWPGEVERLARRIERLEAEAQFVLSDPARREVLLHQVRTATAELEAAKRATLAREATH